MEGWGGKGVGSKAYVAEVVENLFVQRSRTSQLRVKAEKSVSQINPQGSRC